MMIKAIITGDVVHSTRIKKRDELLKGIKKICNLLAKEKYISRYEIYRGDEFQLEVIRPEKALQTAIIIRAYLRKETLPKTTDKTKLWDARISIGLGMVDYKASKIIESTGEAFQKSGKGLDTIKSSDRKMIVNTPWRSVDGEMAVCLRFADAVISHWSTKSAEVAFWHWLYKLKQDAIADKIGVSQPAVNNRFRSAQIKNLNFLLRRYEELVIASGSQSTHDIVTRPE